MNRFIISFLLLIMGFALRAQELTVVSMQETMEVLTADKQRKDLNGNLCALVYVQTPEPGLEFEGNVIGDIEFKSSQYKVYLTAGSKNIRILGNSFIPANVNFSDYEIKALESKRVYTLHIIPPSDGKALKKLQETARKEAQELEQVTEWCDLGDQNYQEENFSEAFKNYKKAADKGFARAQTALGICYAYGQGVEENGEMAFNYFKHAADQKYPEGLFQLGNAYKWGMGTEVNTEEALNYYTMSSELGCANAQNMLGEAYLKGLLGLDKDRDRAQALFEQAAEQGHPEAQKALEVMNRPKSESEKSWDDIRGNMSKHLQTQRKIIENQKKVNQITKMFQH